MEAAIADNKKKNTHSRVCLLCEISPIQPVPPNTLYVQVAKLEQPEFYEMSD